MFGKFFERDITDTGMTETLVCLILKKDKAR